MKSFNDELCSVFENHNLKFNENLGRRNGVLSYAQESFFADEIGKEYSSVFVDGRTGQPDIYIGELEKALNDLTEAINLDSLYWSAYRHRSIVNQMLGRDSQSFEDFINAKKLEA